MWLLKRQGRFSSPIYVFSTGDGTATATANAIRDHGINRLPEHRGRNGSGRRYIPVSKKDALQGRSCFYFDQVLTDNAGFPDVLFHDQLFPGAADKTDAGSII